MDLASLHAIGVIDAAALPGFDAGVMVSGQPV